MNSTRSSKGLRLHSWSNDRLFANVVGRVLRGVAVSNGEHTLRLDFESGPAVYVTTEGNCCSESWWADITGVKQALGHKIYEVEELESYDAGDDGRTRQESDEVYGYKLRTSGGVVTLVFRNSSNGYYGGEARDCELADVIRASRNPFYENEPLRWQLIESNDWQA